MSSKNLTLDLQAKQDKSGKTFYIARLKGPYKIDCKDGVVFLVFNSEVGSEQIQIAPMDNSKEYKDKDIEY